MQIKEKIKNFVEISIIVQITADSFKIEELKP